MDKVIYLSISNNCGNSDSSKTSFFQNKNTISNKTDLLTAADLQN